MHNYLHLYLNLVAARKAVCTQNELAVQLGVSQQEISRYERGEVKAPINYILGVAEVCDVSVDYILGVSRDYSDKLTSEEFELLEIFSKLSSENKIKIIERCETLFEMQNSQK